SVARVQGGLPIPADWWPAGDALGRPGVVGGASGGREYVGPLTVAESAWAVPGGGGPRGAGAAAGPGGGVMCPHYGLYGVLGMSKRRSNPLPSFWVPPIRGA